MAFPESLVPQDLAQEGEESGKFPQVVRHPDACPLLLNTHQTDVRQAVGQTDVSEDGNERADRAHRTPQDTCSQPCPLSLPSDVNRRKQVGTGEPWPERVHAGWGRSLWKREVR